MYWYMKCFKQDKDTSSAGFVLEMMLLLEYSALILYFVHYLCRIATKRKFSMRSRVLNLCLVLSISVRIILFLPPQISYSNTLMVIDMFTAPVCYFSAVSALLSQWYDVFVLARWSHHYNKKYMMIKRFTLTNLVLNLILWTFFVGTIVISESLEEQNLLK
jgi:uncharacterized PurR-regulated membrane protein YhhQ (DUF165 family)